MFVEDNIRLFFYYWFRGARNSSLSFLFGLRIIIENFLHLSVHVNNDFSLTVKSGLGSFFIDPFAYYLGS